MVSQPEQDISGPHALPIDDITFEDDAVARRRPGKRQGHLTGAFYLGEILVRHILIHEALTSALRHRRAALESQRCHVISGCGSNCWAVDSHQCLAFAHFAARGDISHRVNERLRTQGDYRYPALVE